MKFSNDNVAAFIGTLIIHLIALLLLLYFKMSASVPLDDGSIPVIFEDFAPINVPPAAPARSEAPSPTEKTPTPVKKETPPPTVKKPAPKPKETPPTPAKTTTKTQPAPSSKTTNKTPASKPDEKTVTQDRVETVSVPEDTKKTDVAEASGRKEQDAAELKRQQDAERKRQEEVERKQQEATENRVKNSFVASDAQNNSQEETATTTPTQHNPFINSSDSKSNKGADIRSSFDLNGRTIIGVGGLPRPADTVSEAGKIVINITVDPNGNVMTAENGRGTTIDNSTMRKSAREAALRAKFNKIQGTNNQSGTITYIYEQK